MVAGWLRPQRGVAHRRRSSRRFSPTTPRRPQQADEQAYEWATDVLFEVRKQRSEAKQPLKVPITRVTREGRAAAAELHADRRGRSARGAARAGVRDVDRASRARSWSRATRRPSRPDLDSCSPADANARSPRTMADAPPSISRALPRLGRLGLALVYLPTRSDRRTTWRPSLAAARPTAKAPWSSPTSRRPDAAAAVIHGSRRPAAVSTCRWSWRRRVRGPIPRARRSLLTLAAGVALAEGVEARSGLRADLKWPNDRVRAAAEARRDSRRGRRGTGRRRSEAGRRSASASTCGRRRILRSWAIARRRSSPSSGGPSIAAPPPRRDAGGALRAATRICWTAGSMLFSTRGAPGAGRVSAPRVDWTTPGGCRPASPPESTVAARLLVQVGGRT